MALELDARLRAFAALARTGSFSRAADALAISQPGVSRHIAALESQYGVSLVDRGPHGATLTAAGRFLADATLRAEAILSQAERGMTSFSGVGPHRLVLASSGTPGTYLLPPAIAAFSRRYPGVQLDIQLGTSAAVELIVREHHAEFGVTGGFAGSPELLAEPLLEDELVVIGSSAMANAELTRDALEGATWISREEGSATRVAVESGWRALGIAPRSRLEMTSWEAVKLVVAQGAGIAAISRFAIEVELLAGTLCILPLANWHVTRTIFTIRVRDAQLTRPAQDFLAMLHDRWRTPG